MVAQPPKTENHGKYDINGRSWYLRFDDDNNLNYRYIQSIIYTWKEQFNA